MPLIESDFKSLPFRIDERYVIRRAEPDDVDTIVAMNEVCIKRARPRPSPDAIKGLLPSTLVLVDEKEIDDKGVEYGVVGYAVLVLKSISTSFLDEAIERQVSDAILPYAAATDPELGVQCSRLYNLLFLPGWRGIGLEKKLVGAVIGVSRARFPHLIVAMDSYHSPKLEMFKKMGFMQIFEHEELKLIIMLRDSKKAE